MQCAWLVAAAVALACTLSRRQRGQLKKVVRCRAAAQDKDELGACSAIIEGRAGLEFYVRRWDPATAEDIECVLIITHGYLLHSGVFDEAAKQFNACGVAVVSYDWYAHGVSGSLGGIQGLHPSIHDLMNQGSKVVSVVKAHWYPGLPVFMFSDSYGSILNLSMCGHQPKIQEQLAGLVVSGAPIQLPPEMLPLPAVLNVMKMIARGFPLLPMPDPKATDKKHFASAFGDDGWANRIWNDPLVVKSVRLGMLPALFEGFALAKSRLHKVKRVPLLVMHGQNDTRSLYAGALELFERVGGHRKVLKLYEGMRHQLLHGSKQDVEQVIADIVQWMQQLK